MAIWPLTARAQQAATPVVGFLEPTSPEYSFRLAAFRRGLQETGYVDGDNVAIEYRSAENQISRLPELAVDLVRRKVAVIATTGGIAAASAAKKATSTIPIVFVVAEDPVKLGLVTSLARPGGNATGINFFSAELVAKRLALLRELIPNATRMALLINPTGPTHESTLKDFEAAAPAIGLQMQVARASTAREIDAAFASFEHERPDALFVGTDPFFTTRRVQLILLATRYAIPATYPGRQYPEIGGLISYGANNADAYRQAGIYAGQVLKGAKPADLPVLQAAKFELVINHQAARTIGLTVPQSLLVAADEVFE